MARSRRTALNSSTKTTHRTANPDLAQAMAQLRRSSAASPHTPRPRKGTRGAQRRRDINDSIH